jgi:hypothetical protein
MELKLSKKALEEKEKALLQKEKALEEKEKALEEKEKALAPKEKKASFNDRLIAYFKDLASKKDSGALIELQTIIGGLASPADKWNYIALSWQLFKNLKVEDFKFLKNHCETSSSAGAAFYQLKTMFPKKEKSENISAESR